MSIRRQALPVLLLALASCGLLPASSAVGQEEPVLCFGETATIAGTPGNDRITGTRGRDVIQTLGGNDVVRGLGGDDFICGDTGRDRLYGGKGDDTLQKESGGAVMDGGPGDDRLFGGLGDDLMRGGSGADQMFGGHSDEEDFSPGNDRMYGGPGDDFLSGGLGDDRLFGGPGDDDLDGGIGQDLLEGGPGENTIVDPDVPPPPPPPAATLADLIDASDRAGIRDWASSRSIAAINSAVAALDQAHRDKLAEVILDTNATGEPRDKMLRVVRAVLAVPDLGFYSEIWSYTFVELTGGGFFGTCNHLFLSPDAWGGLSDIDARLILMHESFHSFNCVNGGPAGALNEGSAIWITFAPFTAPLLPGQSFAETTYGTKLYYRDLAGQPDYPLEAAINPTQKLIDVYNYLSAHDPSQLPWNSNDRLVTCFNRYFVDLNRNVDFFNEWLPAVEQRTDQMLADPECKPV